MKINLACSITLLRILLTPVVVIFMVQNSWHWALAVFAGAILTDVADGFVARALQQQSKFGQMLDPVADKILLGSVLYTMLFLMSESTLESSSLFSMAAYFLLCKELVLLFGGAVLWLSYKIFIPPSVLSRAVSLCEVIFVFAVFISKAFMVQVPEFVLIGIILINVALSVWLLLRYALFLKKI